MMARMRTSRSWIADLHWLREVFRDFYSAKEGAVYGGTEGNLLV
jgi:DNA-binding LytR/AlgR family response regulator